MLQSHLYMPTLRQNLSEAELAGHQLLLRGGFIRRVGTGQFVYLPLMQRVMRRLESLARQTFERFGAMEVRAPSVRLPAGQLERQPGDGVPGDATNGTANRDNSPTDISAMHGLLVAALTGEVRSYRQLPLKFFTVASRLDPQAHPWHGLLTSREFSAAECLLLAADDTQMAALVEELSGLLVRLGDLIGLKLVAAKSLGGEDILAVTLDSGTDDVILSCDQCGYTAISEAADFGGEPGRHAGSLSTLPMELVETPGMRTVEQVADFFGVEASQIGKTVICLADGKPLAVLLSGDRELNLPKLKKTVNASVLEMADEATVVRVTGAPVGFAGPVGLRDVPVIVDCRVMALSNFVTGANRADHHWRGINIGRDFQANVVADIVLARDNDVCPHCPGRLTARTALRLARLKRVVTAVCGLPPMEVTEDSGERRSISVAFLRWGLSRTVQAVVQANRDEAGIVWPARLAPFDLHLLNLEVDKAVPVALAERVANAVEGRGFQVLVDDRGARPGVKFAESELLGIPWRLVIGGKALAQRALELQTRAGGRREMVPLDEVAERVLQVLKATA